MVGSKTDVFEVTGTGWTEALDRLPHDVYHRPEYHSLPGFGHQGKPLMFSYREGETGTFLWPYLLRPIAGTGDYDVSSVYGYAGPLCSGDGEFAERAWLALQDHWRSRRVVSAFTRFHPILGNAPAVFSGLAGAGQDGLMPAGSTVSIDLTIPPEDQVRRYQKVLRQEIRKAREAGFVTEEDREWTATSEFLRLYRETMARRNSRQEYLVDEAWVGEFRQALGGRAKLFVTTWNGAVAAALLAIEYSPFLHAHLTGINAELSAHSPLKVLLDDIRAWGAERGLSWFHLGGGLGGREDSLFQFKRRFSPVTHTFQTGRWILDAARYRELAEAHRESLLRTGFRIGNPDFFPVYRYPPVAADACEPVECAGAAVAGSR